MMNTMPSSHMSGWTWLAIAGFALFAIGLVNPLLWRATFFHREAPLKPAVSNSLMGLGVIFIVVGLVVRSM